MVGLWADYVQPRPSSNPLTVIQRPPRGWVIWGCCRFYRRFGAVAGPTWLAGWLLAYGAVILAFVGAIHWGLAMSADRPLAEPFYASVLPALVGWIALLMPPLMGLPVLIAGFIAWRVWEHRAAPVALPSWFRRLRSVLTVGAVLGLSVGWIGLLPFTGTG